MAPPSSPNITFFSMIVLGLCPCSPYPYMTPTIVCFFSRRATLIDLLTKNIECVYAWVHQSWYQVSSVFLFSVFPALIYFGLVYAYYQQTVNRNHAACLFNTFGDDRSNHQSAPLLGRRRMEMTTSTSSSSQSVVGGGGYTDQRDNITNHISNRKGMTSGRMEHAHNLFSPRRWTAHWHQVPKSIRKIGAAASNHLQNNNNNNNNNNVVVNNPVKRKPPFVSKGLKRGHRQPPLIQSPSPIGLSPGPPSYRPSKVYAAFAAPVLSWDEIDLLVVYSTMNNLTDAHPLYSLTRCEQLNCIHHFEHTFWLKSSYSKEYDDKW